ncbi:MAG TPA: PAS domain S-box protein [Acidobacteriota bacterium]|nr:PAS domain S-box protein [Acidobacteriota bacterium]
MSPTSADPAKRTGLTALLEEARQRIERLQSAESRRLCRWELEGRRDLLQAVVDSLPMPIFWKDRNSIYLGANQRFCRDAGVQSPLELLGKTDYDMVWQRRQADFFRECDQRVMSSDRAQRGIKETLLRADGSEVLVETDKFPLHDQDGQVIGILGTYHVILGAEDAAEAQQESELNFRDLVESVNDIIFSLALDGTILYISPVSEQITGFHPSEVMGRPFHSFVHEEDLESLEKSFKRTLSGDLDPMEFRIMTKEGEMRWVRSSSRPVRRQGDVVGVRGVMADITERRALEQQLRQAQKMEAIGQLAGGVAHDFNNLLTTILGHCDLMAYQMDEEHPLRENISEVRKSAVRASSLTQQLLTFGRKQMVSLVRLDVNEVVRGTEGMLRRLIGADIQFRIRLAHSVWKIKGDQTQLEQVVLNLVVNARDAMPEGGTLTVQTRNEPLSRPRALPQFSVPSGEWVVLAVRDTGTGIDPELQAHIFEPFFTTKDVGKGTGLGLATVYGIVKQCGGYVVVESSRGEGTVFEIYLPRSQSGAVEEAPQALHPPTKASPPSGSETILVVEDDSGVRMLMCQILRDRGYAVIEAKHPGEALLTSEQYQDPIDLMVTDVVMPHMSGPQLAGRLKPERPDMKVLYVSGYAGETAALRGIPDGEFLQKPYKPDVFAAKVREMLDG